MVKFRFFIPDLWDFIHMSIFHMSRCKLRTPSPIHFKLRTVIGIENLKMLQVKNLLMYHFRKTLKLKAPVQWPVAVAAHPNT
jgi:hypothetical protein